MSRVDVILCLAYRITRITYFSDIWMKLIPNLSKSHDVVPVSSSCASLDSPPECSSSHIPPELTCQCSLPVGTGPINPFHAHFIGNSQFKFYSLAGHTGVI